MMAESKARLTSEQQKQDETEL